MAAARSGDALVVAQIVAVAHEGVDGAHGFALREREQQEGEIEVLRLRARDLDAPLVGLFDSDSRRSCGRGKRPAGERAQQQTDALDFRNRRTRAEDIVILLLDLFEDFQAAAAE